jgi:carbon monoxide dehydrogenase subunit G
MEFDDSFTVEKPLDQVWSTMVDLGRVVPCVPGATVLERTGDKAVKAEVKIKLGSMSMNYSGPAEIVEQDDDAHRAVLSARAKEAGGQGNADAKVSMQRTGAGDATEVALHSQVNVTGKAAQMGRA